MDILFWVIASLLSVFAFAISFRNFFITIAAGALAALFWWLGYRDYIKHHPLKGDLILNNINNHSEQNDLHQIARAAVAFRRCVIAIAAWAILFGAVIFFVGDYYDLAWKISFAFKLAFPAALSCLLCAVINNK